MARKPVSPLEWRDIYGEDGMVLGHYTVDGGMIVVQSAQGWEKHTQLGDQAAQAGLARLIVSEAPPSSFGRFQ